MKGFFAYPERPSDIGRTIEASLATLKSHNNGVIVRSWKELDIPGHFIATEVISSIEKSDVLFADISILNFNVTYEIGFAIGSGRRVIITKNKSIKEGDPTIRDVGIFDTIGYKEYENSESLLRIIKESDGTAPIDINHALNQQAPVYLLDTKHKTDWIGRIISRIKKSKYFFRSFDPNEMPRLPAYDAIHNVSQSYGVVVTLLSKNHDGNSIHNMRAAFIAGLAKGMNKPSIILQDGDDPVPLDYRDFVRVSTHPRDIDDAIADFAGTVAEKFQESTSLSRDDGESFLQALDLGASFAENEMRTLEKYYLKTDQFLKALRGEANLVVGRKGSGKSAIFLQVRDRERSNKENVVLDLKPDGYKLIKFKELLLDFLEEGTFQHTIMAFWEYVLLLEICYKILEKDAERHLNDSNLYEPYRRLAELYKTEGYATEGDFSERMSGLMEKITSDFHRIYGYENEVRLSVPQVTEILYCHDVKKLADEISSYMKNKGTLWLLFDNIDKGWPASGLKHEDLMIIRALVDAARKMKQQFDRRNADINAIVFLRNDVFELLIKETSDRGKEASVLLDWTDAELLREIIRLRIVSNSLDKATRFGDAWLRVCVSHYKGEESSQYLIERSLMRPRFLLNLINHCKSFAINLGHKKIEAEDIEKGLSSYSTDVLADIGYEISDVLPDAQNVLYAFIDCPRVMDKDEIFILLDDYKIDQSLWEKIFDLLLWYGLLGVKKVGSDEELYIYDFKYQIALLSGFMKKNDGSLRFCINPAFLPGLMINGNKERDMFRE